MAAFENPAAEVARRFLASDDRLLCRDSRLFLDLQELAREALETAARVEEAEKEGLDGALTYTGRLYP